MGDPPMADKPGKLLEPLESVSWCTCTWPLEGGKGGNWGSLSLRAIAPRADRGELSYVMVLNFLFNSLNFNDDLAIA